MVRSLEVLFPEGDAGVHLPGNRCDKAWVEPTQMRQLSSELFTIPGVFEKFQAAFLSVPQYECPNCALFVVNGSKSK
jgi:hypothetical protein